MLRVAMSVALVELGLISAVLESAEARLPGVRLATLAIKTLSIAVYAIAMMLLARGKAPAAEPELAAYDDIHPAMRRGRALDGHARLDGEPPWCPA
jgi:hypothetical protein